MLVSGGWRSGKSVVIAAELVPHCIVPSEVPYLGAIIGPTYKEPKVEFEYLVDWLVSLGVLDKKRDVSIPKDGPCEFTIPPKQVQGKTIYFATVRTYTASEVEAIRSFNADFVAISEAGGISEEAFYTIMGRVLSTGGFILGTGTLETSEKWYYSKIKSGRLPGAEIPSVTIPTWDNLVMFPGGRDDPKIQRAERTLPKNMFDVRIAAEPVRMTGVCIQDVPDTLISRDAVYQPGVPVELAIDPGFTGAFAVLALQQFMGEIRVIDEVYVRLMGVDEVVAECQSREWWNDIDPNYPGVIDRAAKQHHSGDSVLEQWFERTDQWMDLTEAVIPVNDGIDQLRLIVKSGLLKINPDCKGLLAEWDLCEPPWEQFDPWHYKPDKDGVLKGDKAVIGNDHASTALIYWLVNRFGFLTPDSLSAQFGHNQMFNLRRDDFREDQYGPFTAERVK